MIFSLNDLVIPSVQFAAADTEVNLDDALPKVFKFETDTNDNILMIAAGIFGQLIHELNTNGQGKFRISTSQDAENQYVCFDHEGSINDGKLQSVNANLTEIADGKPWESKRKSGNRIAAQELTKLGGTVQLRHIQDGTSFKVRTLVTIPTPTE
jgi:hypothetical protein